MLPEGWNSYRLGNILSFKNGLNFTRSDAGEFIKIVGVSDFKDRVHLETTEKLTTVQIAGNLRDDELLKAGDLLFVRSNGNKALIGRCLYFPKINERISFSGFTIRARVKNSALDPLFASYLMRSRGVLDQIFLGGSGTNISNLSQDILNNIEVEIPSFVEQRDIAVVLSTWDEAISAAEQMVINSQQQRSGLVQALIGDRSRKLRGEAILHKVPASDIFRPRSVRRNDGLELLSVMQDIGVVPRSSLERKVVMPEGSTESYKLVEAGDFVISLRSFEGGLEYSRFRGLVSPAYTVLRPIKPIINDFYRHYFKSKEFIGRLAVAVIGIRDGKQISYEDFEFLKLPYPSIPEQQAIADVLNAAEQAVKNSAKYLQLLRKEKSALMSQLLTGKRRVKLTEEDKATQT